MIRTRVLLFIAAVKTTVTHGPFFFYSVLILQTEE